jgi:DNA mismatch endonuclease (patch repair protein)
MSDVHDRETRSFNMSRIRSRDTKPELLVRRFLFTKGFRYKLHEKKLPGKPDIVLPKHRTVIFVHGCFWHGHKGCKYFVVPKTRTAWWMGKIRATSQRDLEKTLKIQQDGWKVITIFECELRGKDLQRTQTRIINRLSGALRRNR